MESRLLLEWDSTNPRESVLSPTLATLATRNILRPASSRRSYFVNKRRFTEFIDGYFHIPLPIVTKHELGLPFPLGTFA